MLLKRPLMMLARRSGELSLALSTTPVPPADADDGDAGSMSRSLLGWVEPGEVMPSMLLPLGDLGDLGDEGVKAGPGDVTLRPRASRSLATVSSWALPPLGLPVECFGGEEG
jgi:hypothetical protein